MRTWAEDDPKAVLMAGKRASILDAALQAFLAEGYAGSSVNRIAAVAGVSIKTLYRHFDDKEDLFVSVIQAACDASSDSGEPAWLGAPPEEGLVECGRDHLAHVLSAEQVALYRVVVAESPRFPELGRRYRREVNGFRVNRFTRYLDTWPPELRSGISDPGRATRLFGTLLQDDLLDVALLGGSTPSRAEIDERARQAAADFLSLLQADTV